MCAHVVVFSCHFRASQSEQKTKKGEDMDADDEKMGDDEDSQFMKLAKKLTAKTLQRKGWSIQGHTGRVSWFTNTFPAQARVSM